MGTEPICQATSMMQSLGACVAFSTEMWSGLIARYFMPVEVLAIWRVGQPELGVSGLRELDIRQKSC